MKLEFQEAAPVRIEPMVPSLREWYSTTELHRQQTLTVFQILGSKLHTNAFQQILKQV